MSEPRRSPATSPFYDPRLGVRHDLDDAHQRVWHVVRSCGRWWTAPQRRVIAATVIAAFNDPAPPPPWVAYTGDATRRTRIEDLTADACDDDLLPVLDAAARMTAHASSITASWYDAHTEPDGALMGEQAYVELCGIVMAVSAVCSFARTIGAALPPLASADDARAPSQEPVPAERGPRNWVPVTPPGGSRASVIEALSVAPAEYDLLWSWLAPAQYMTNEQMDDLAFTRGTISRPQAELLAGRVAALRQCFF